MNMHIKGHHMTRQIAGIQGSLKGNILVTFERHAPFESEYLLFFPDELDCTAREILLIASTSKGEQPFDDIPGDLSGFTSNDSENKV